MVVGVLPMAGSGSRLGLPFPKFLAPTITEDGRIVPLYQHALDRLRVVARDNYAVLSPTGMFDPCVSPTLPDDLRAFGKPAQGDLPSSLAVIARKFQPHQRIAVALPDSIWYPEDGFAQMLADWDRCPEWDGVFGVFYGDARVLDRVEYGEDGTVTAVHRHADDGPARGVEGWGCFIARASVLQTLTDAEPLGPQLGAHHFGFTFLGRGYYDLGTPQRYADLHDLRAI